MVGVGVCLRCVVEGWGYSSVSVNRACAFSLALFCGEGLDMSWSTKAWTLEQRQGSLSVNMVECESSGDGKGQQF